jgi:hypothetical protein
MPDYPFRKFVVVQSHRDAEVGHLVRKPEEEDHHHLDLIACSIRKNRGIDIYDDPDSIPEVTINGWLLGDDEQLAVVFQVDYESRLQVEALRTLARWAAEDFTITKKGA